MLLAPVAMLGLGAVQEKPGDTGSSLKVIVDARHPWVRTGLTMQKGEQVSFKAEGTIQWGPGAGDVAGPDGHDPKNGKVGKGGLIGRIGVNGKPFSIGNTSTPFAMPKNGELFLGINDFIFADNAGQFTVTISRTATSQKP